MYPYKDSSSQSGVEAYEIADRSISVRFKDGNAYLYSYARPGADDVEKMKKLALSGQGLATFINQNVRECYERKLKWRK